MLTEAIAQAKPGDSIILKNGNWPNLNIHFNSKATASYPIYLCAETAGKVVLSGSSKIVISKPHLQVSGLLFTDGAINKGSVITMAADSCKISNLAVVNYNPPTPDISYTWVLLKGSYNKVEHCLFSGKNNNQQVIVNSEGSARYNVITYCYFKNIPLIAKNNGREIIKVVGYGHSDEVGEDGAFCTIAYNLFDHADGEGVEIVSIKSNHNLIKNNCVIASCGALVNRRGSYNVFENNIILGTNKPRTLGIRIANQNNTVINNYISDVAGSGLVLMSGEYTDSMLTNNYSTQPRLKRGKMVREPSYGAVKYCSLLHNTLVNCEYGIDIGFGYKKDWDKKQIILIPEENKISYNLIVHAKREGLNMVKQDSLLALNKFKFKANELKLNYEADATDANIKLLDNLFYSYKANNDIGADVTQLKLLTEKDVGPAWMK